MLPRPPTRVEAKCFLKWLELSTSPVVEPKQRRNASETVVFNQFQFFRDAAAKTMVLPVEPMSGHWGGAVPKTRCD